MTNRLLDRLKGLAVKLPLVRRRWGIAISVALVLAIVTVAIPVHIEVGVPSGQPVLTIRHGGSAYTIVIGNPVSATDADYTCDGTDDNVQFQAALDALPAAGGQLLVLAGDYVFATATTVSRAIDDVSIIGVGASVSFTCDATTAIFTAGGNSWLFSNFETDAGGLAMGATTDWMWLNITIGTTYYALDTEDDPAVDTSGTPVDDDFAKFTDADTIEGRSYAEVRTDLGLVPDTDVPAQASFDDHSARHESGGGDAIKLDDLATPDDNTDLDSSLTEHGLLLKLGGGTTNFLRADGTWAAPAGGGDVSGPASSTDNMIARHSGTGGKTLQDYTSNPPTISDSGDMNVDGDIDVDSIILKGILATAETELEISTGAITVTQMRHKVDTEGISDIDDLDTINGGGTVNLIILRAAFDNKTIVVKHNTGNIWLQGKQDIRLDDIEDGILLAWDATNSKWFDIANAGNVYGPTASIDNSIVRYNGTTGKFIQDYNSNAPTISDTGDMNVDGDIDVDNVIVSGNVDGRDVSVDGTKLDGIDTGADVTGDNAPQAHAASHQNAGGDEMSVTGLSGLLADDQHVLDAEVQAIKLDDFATPDDNTDLDSSLTEHGLLPKLGGGTTNFFRADGTWAVPAGGGTVDTSGIPVTNDFARFTDADTIEGRSYAEVKADLSLEIGTDVLAEQTIGIADDNLLEVDDADAANDDYAKFTADGLEGRSYAEVRTDLGLVIGTNVQAYDAELTIIAGLSIADGNLMVGNGSTWVVESGATVRTSLGLGTGDTPQFTGIEVGDVADTTLARSSAGHVSVEGDVLLGESDVDDTPADGDTSDPISSNWAYDHDADGSAHQSNVITITFVINGGGSAISTGEWGHLEIPFACTITQATLCADQSGSIVIDIWKDTYGNFPPTDGDSITASAPPTLSSAQKSQDSTLSGWTTSVSAGDILAFNIDSCATIEIITLSLRATKT